MNNGSDRIENLFLWLLHKSELTISSPSGIESHYSVRNPEKILETGPESAPWEERIPMLPQASQPRFSNLSEKRSDSEAAQSLNVGDIAIVQDRFQALLRHKFQQEYQNRPPLFAWETEVEEYPEQLPTDIVQPQGEFWTAHLRHLRAANVLPEALLVTLTERCQVLSQAPLKQGIKLVRIVEALFPDHDTMLEPIAKMVLVPAYRSETSSQDAAIRELIDFAGGYEMATPEQQIALSMLAAQEIMAVLTLSISPERPRLEREWLTAQGMLQLTAAYQAKPEQLFVQANLPTGGSLRLGDGTVDKQALRLQPGCLDLVWTDPQPGQPYRLEVALADINPLPLCFNVSFVRDTSS